MRGCLDQGAAVDVGGCVVEYGMKESGGERLRLGGLYVVPMKWGVWSDRWIAR